MSQVLVEVCLGTFSGGSHTFFFSFRRKPPIMRGEGFTPHRKENIHP